MRRKKIISAALGCCLVLGQAVGFSACGERPVMSEEEIIELIEPNSEIAGSETVMRRDMFTAKVYEVMVDPYIEEYSYEETRNFLPTGRRIGDTVKAGDIIYKADISSLAPRIEKLTEKLEELTESYAEYYYELRTKINEQNWELSVLEGELEEIRDKEPENKRDPGYDAWRKLEEKAEGAYNKKELDMIMNEAALSEREELLHLDYDYYAEQLQELLLQNEAGVLRSDISGQIVYLEMCDEGSTIQAGTVVAAVADMNRKRLVCSGLDNAAKYGTGEKYAFFNGRKYDIVYDEASSSAKSSVFLLQDPNEEVPVGSYGNLVIYSSMKRQVLTVPREAVHNAGREQYVYVLEGGKPVSRSVRTGLMDDVYTEIQSGLEEGETVFLDKSGPQVSDTVLLERKSVSVTYTVNGTLSYPIWFNVRSDVGYGKISFQGWSAYEKNMKGQVCSFASLPEAKNLQLPLDAGDVIANIKVDFSEAEKLEMEQLERDLKRAEERLADLLKTVEDSGGEIDRELKKDIESRQEAVEQMREELSERVEAYSTTEIRTERGGRLIWLGDKIYYQSGGQSTGINVQKGDEMGRNHSYAQIADTSMAYLLLPDGALGNNGRIGYNTTMNVSYYNWQNEVVEREFPVIKVNRKGNCYALLLDSELLQDMNIYKESNQSGVREQTSLAVTGKIKCMENVLLLPENAIKLLDSNVGYVNVLEKDGRVWAKKVVVGGKYQYEKREHCYCVLEGLEEGMTVCWE